MIRIELSLDPYSTPLFCPYCGENTLDPDSEGNVTECIHLVYYDMDEDPEDSDEKFGDADLCFVFFEGPPASREHFFVFRPTGSDPDEQVE